MRILFLGTLPPHPGGTAFVGAQILRGLTRRGHEILALAPITAAALARGDRFAEENPDILVRRFLVPHFEIIPGLRDDYLQVERDQLLTMLPQAFGRLGPDVVLIGRESFGWHLPLILARSSVPTALIVHGGSTFTGLTGETNGRAGNLRKLFGSIGLLIPVATHIATGLEAVGLTHTALIPNPVDVRLFRPQPPDGMRTKLGIADEDNVVVHVSNLKPVKRPLDLVHLAAMTPEARLTYVVVGDGPLRQEMEQQCRARNVSQRFRFVGWVSHEQVPQFLNLADMVIMPSESEGQALAHLETQACGRLLIASDTPGAREVVRDGETGLLFPTGSLHDLAATTAMAAGNPVLRATIGRAAETAVQSHALDVIASKYEAALQDMVESKAAGFRPNRLMTRPFANYDTRNCPLDRPLRSGEEDKAAGRQAG